MPQELSKSNVIEKIDRISSVATTEISKIFLIAERQIDQSQFVHSTDMACILTMYAFLEGVIKVTSSSFLEYLKYFYEQNPNSKLKSHFFYLLKFNNVNNSKKFQKYINALFDEVRIFDPTSFKITANNNLKYYILIMILHFLSLNIHYYESMTMQVESETGESREVKISIEKYLDDLVTDRNTLAHNGFGILNETFRPKHSCDEYKQLVRYLINTFTDEVKDIITNESFLI